MKRILPLILISLAVGLTAAPPERPARQIRIQKQIAAAAAAENTEIVIAANAPKTIRFAAKELQGFLREIFGKNIPVVHQPSTGKVSFILGVNSWTQEAGLDTGKLVRDAFIIRTIGSRVYIAGLDDPKADPEKEIARGGVWGQLYERGTLFGVYDFLERIAGVRMYFPGELGTVIPKAAELQIPEMDIYDRPDFIQRRYSAYWDGTYFEGENRDAVIHPAKNLNQYRLRMETEMIPCAHGLNSFRYIQRFGKTHPEYFALQSNGKRSNDPAMPHPGQLCYTSGIVEEIYQDVRSYLKGESAEVRGIPAPGNTSGYGWGPNTWGIKGKYVDIMPQDAFSGCFCPKCLAAYKKGDPQYASEVIWGNTLGIAERLKKEGISGYITMMVYTPYRRIPAQKIPDNVMVMVAETGPWSKGNPEQKQRDDNEIRSWSKKLGHKVWLWNYVNKYGALQMPGIPQMSPRAYGEYYQNLAPWIFGAFAESENDRFIYNYLNYYVFAKIAWDNKTDLKDLLDEHYRLLFGKAAPEMRSFYELLEDKWVGQVAGRVSDTPLGPMTVPPSDQVLWTDIYSADVQSTLNDLLVRAVKAVPADSKEAARIALIRREFYEPLQQAYRKWRSTTDKVKGLKFHLSAEPENRIRLHPFIKPDAECRKTVETAVRAWKTETALHIRFECAEPEIGNIAAIRRKADDPDIWRDNSVEVFLNPSGDRKTYYHLLMNSEGSLSDQKCVRLGAGSSSDFSWNSDASVKVEKLADAWIAEIAVPLKNLPGMKAEFPANFARNRILKHNGGYEPLYQWSPFTRGFHDLENYGSLSAEPDRNLIINSDFSIPAKHTNRHFGIWQGFEWQGGWIGDAANPPALDNAVCISLPAGLRLQGKDVQIQQSLPKLKPNTRYRLSFYVKLTDVKPLTRGGGVCANIWDDANRWFPAHNWMTGTTDWTFQSYEFTSGKKTNAEITSYIRLRILGAEGTVWFDDVRLEEI